MTSKKITELDEITTAGADDDIPTVDDTDATTKRITAGNLLASGLPITTEVVQALDSDGIALKNDGGDTVATIEDGGMLNIDGGFKLVSTSISAAGPTDNVDVTGKNILIMDSVSNNVTVGGLVGGVEGQILFVVKKIAANNATLEHNEGGGSQDIFLPSGADETLTGVKGGWVLYCGATAWTALNTH